MKEKEELIDEMQSAFARLPRDTREVLALIVDPKVIEHTKRYIEAMDVNSRCLNYKAPWSCIKEAEAYYQNIKYGWLGAASGMVHSESWCDNCRRKVMDGPTPEQNAEEDEVEDAIALDILNDQWPSGPV